MTPIEVDPEALLLVDVAHVYWPVWHATGSAIEAYRTTIERCERMARIWPHMVICCDSPTNWRHKLTEHLEPSERYKANRKAKPPDAFTHLVDAQERLGELGLCVAQADNYEADDVIATLKSQAFLQRVIVMTEDKDLAQLVDDACVLWTRDGERGADDVERTYGVKPPLMRDLLAMCGDSSDNVRGILRIGPVNAARLLNTYGSIAGVKEAVEKDDFSFRGIGPERRQAIRDWDPELAVKLVSLAYDAPVRLEDVLQRKNQVCQTDAFEF